jgi:hypothetical protein
MRYFTWLLALSLSLPACAQQKLPRKNRAATAVTVPTPSREAEPVLVFQQTPCNGRCPTYTATIFADGRVEYNGQRYVPRLGNHTLSLPPATVAKLLAEAKSLHFEQLQERYAGSTTDLPATIITVRQPGAAAKVVYAAESIPEKLQGYINLLKHQLEPLAGLNMQE